MSRAFRLGLFVVATLAIFAGGVFLIGNREFLFRSTYRLNAEFQNVSGLGGGAEVRVGGIDEGTVHSIDLPHNPGQKVRVVMDMSAGTRDVIKKDSVASIQAEGLVGDKYVEITFGSEQAPKVKNGDYIQGQPPLEMAALMKKANSILDGAQTAVQTIGEVSNNVNGITAKVNSGQGTVGALINDRSAYRSINAGAAELQEDMEALKHNFLLRGFFKNRGYEDSADLTKYLIARLPDGPAEKQFTYNPSKLFDQPGSAKLKDAKMLREAGEYLQDHPFGLAVVAVYAGMKGDTDKDRVLAEARALVVREQLTQNFRFDDTRVKTAGMGKSKEEDSSVEILVYPAAVNTAGAGGLKRR
jgi:phospholipid/cholesterol/gamma-HCH transport system substrate-binding protein